MSKLNILILGASYGSLLAIKLLYAGHDVTLVCLPAEVEAINADGIRVRLPVRGRSENVELDSRTLPGRLRASGPDAVDPEDFDLVGLAMQEPQYGSAGVRELLGSVARSRLPCMSIMNMPPLSYLRRIPGLAADDLRPAFTDPDVWMPFEPARLTLCSPDPQAYRPPEEPVNVLQVTLPTNFKVASFESHDQTAMLRRLQNDIETVRHETAEGPIELPVKLKVHDSLFVPLAKWAMLLTGNYRCVTKDGPLPIRDAVHSDLPQSASVYRWVNQVCVALGAAETDLVPFESYAAAAKSLDRPSSAARAVFAGARNIERVDRLVQIIAGQMGMTNPVVDETVNLVDLHLQRHLFE